MARRQRSGHERNRTNRSYSRRAGKRTPLQSICIVCDAKKTEPTYSNALRRKWGLTSVNVITVRGGDCRSAVKIAIGNNDEYDQCWCVFDTETVENAGNVQAAIERAKAKDVELAISNPAFEFWLLLHFVQTDRPFENAQALLQELRQHLPEYEKADDVYARLEPAMPEAIKRAQQVLNAHESAASGQFPNPSTTVHLLVQELYKLYERT